MSVQFSASRVDIKFENLICRQICQEAGESRPGGSRGGFRFGCPVMASAVVAHDGGVRLICAGWVPQDDDSDVNVTAVYSRASRTIFVESRCGS